MKSIIIKLTKAGNKVSSFAFNYTSDVNYIEERLTFSLYFIDLIDFSQVYFNLSTDWREIEYIGMVSVDPVSILTTKYKNEYN
jgi:hypothetical protein